MTIVKLSSTNQQAVISKAVNTLKNNGLIIYPTETCYGAGVCALNQPAVTKLLNYKSRPEGKAVSIAVLNQNMASKYVNLNTSAKNLYKNFLPGPLTIISKSKKKVAVGLESETSTLGIRIPDFPLVLKIIKKLNLPITATSANVSYQKTPYAVKDILKHTSKKQQSLIDLIIDAGTLPKHAPSTVVDTTLDDPLILRQGKLTLLSKDKIVTRSPLETINLAKTIMLKNNQTFSKHPLVFLLIGDLGAGKTQFAKGIGRFLKIKNPITSPTYTILKEYPYSLRQTKGLFVHLDTWRLQNIDELNLLNLGSYFKPKNIIAVEWADRTLKPLQTLAQKQKAKLIIIKLETCRPSSSSCRQVTFLS